MELKAHTSHHEEAVVFLTVKDHDEGKKKAVATVAPRNARMHRHGHPHHHPHHRQKQRPAASSHSNIIMMAAANPVQYDMMGSTDVCAPFV